MTDTIYHVHHIVPKHDGGTDDPDNLIRLSVKDHAEAHRLLYEQHGKEEDRIAWLGLSGVYSNQEVVYYAEQLGRSKGGLANKGIPKSDEHKEKIALTIKEKYNSKDMRKKTSDAMKGNTNSKNHSSEEYRKAQSERLKAAWKKRKEGSLAQR